MTYKQENHKTNWLSGFMSLAIVMVLLALMLPVTLDASQYYVWGRVYSSLPLDEDEAVPPNPLTGVDTTQVLGDDMYAVIPRNLVRVRVIKASDRSELASFITTRSGGYFVSFTAPGATFSVKFIVEELLSGDLLLESDANVLNEWTLPSAEYNIRYLLVPGGLTDIGADREFALCPVGKHTGIFTRVGKIEVATEVEDPPGVFTTKHLIDPLTGLVYIYTSTIATDLAIHQYKDSPLGGNLFMFGAFNQALYYVGASYRIRIEKWNDATSSWVFDKYMDDELVKTRYTVNLTPPITVTADRIRLGPDTFMGTPNCYTLTPLSTGNTFWSFPDLLALWRTSRGDGLNGKYKVSLEVVGLLPGFFVHVPQYTDLTMTLDNVPPEAKIKKLYASGFDTPMIYTPGPPVTSYDLLAAMLGTSANYGPTADPTCSILEFTNPTQHLAFKLTAYHDNGYLLHWYFKFKRNDTGYTTITGKKYSAGPTPGTGSMVDYTAVPPMKIACSQNSEKGFQDMYLYLNPGHINLGDPDGCAYRFVIHAKTRATDGYGYLRWRWDEDLHYMKR
jgi:hypothetical protein